MTGYSILPYLAKIKLLDETPMKVCQEDVVFQQGDNRQTLG